MRIDLQLHSTYSDGYLTPTKLVHFAKKNGIEVVSLTDHNTVRGLHEFKRACREHKIKFIKGLELYVKLGHKKFNLLWYNFDDSHPDLHDMLRDSQVRRRRMARRVLNNLVKIGFEIDTNKILDKYNHYVPINQLVDDIILIKSNLEKIKKDLGVEIPREEDIIKRYFHNEKIGKLKPSYISFSRIVKLRKKIGGYLILCHPAKHSYIDELFWAKLKKMGMDGVELLSPHHSYGAIMHIQKLARELGWIETGGSDFHRFEGGGHLIQHAWQYYRINSDNLRGIKKIIK